MQVLGLPLETAIARLEGEGYQVAWEETRSPKPWAGGALRVLRAREIGPGQALLTCGAFGLPAGAPEAG